MTNSELLDDSVGTENGGGLKSQHGLLALWGVLADRDVPDLICMTHVEAGQGLAVRIELIVVELDELLCSRGESPLVSRGLQHDGRASHV